MVRAGYRKQLSDFLKRRRGKQTYAAFARKLGISGSTLQRLEAMQQNVTIDTLEQILKRLRCRVSDVLE